MNDPTQQPPPGGQAPMAMQTMTPMPMQPNMGFPLPSAPTLPPLAIPVPTVLPGWGLQPPRTEFWTAVLKAQKAAQQLVKLHAGPPNRKAPKQDVINKATGEVMGHDHPPMWWFVSAEDFIDEARRVLHPEGLVVMELVMLGEPDGASCRRTRFASSFVVAHAPSGQGGVFPFEVVLEAAGQGGSVSERCATRAIAYFYRGFLQIKRVDFPGDTSIAPGEDIYVYQDDRQQGPPPQQQGQQQFFQGPPQGHFNGPPQGQFNVPPQGHGFNGPPQHQQGHFNGPPQGQFNGPPPQHQQHHQQPHQGYGPPQGQGYGQQFQQQPQGHFAPGHGPQPGAYPNQGPPPNGQQNGQRQQNGQGQQRPDLAGNSPIVQFAHSMVGENAPPPGQGPEGHGQQQGAPQGQQQGQPQQQQQQQRPQQGPPPGGSIPGSSRDEPQSVDEWATCLVRLGWDDSLAANLAVHAQAGEEVPLPLKSMISDMAVRYFGSAEETRAQWQGTGFTPNPALPVSERPKPTGLQLLRFCRKIDWTKNTNQPAQASA